MRNRNTLVILTGLRGCGKTSLLKNLIERHDLNVQGFLSCKEFSGSLMTGINLVVLPGKTSMPMATTTPFSTPVSTGRFYFFAETFGLIERHFNTIRPKIPFIFDEFGQLEMRQEGHYPLFQKLIEKNHPLLLVVRKEMLEEFLATLPQETLFVIFDMNEMIHQDINSNILEFLENSASLCATNKIY